MKNLIDYFWNMTRDEQMAYASRAGCSVHHLVNNVYRRAGPLKLPRPELLIRLVSASEGQVSLDDAIEYFLVSPVKKLAAELTVAPDQAMPPRGGATMKRFDAGDKGMSGAYGVEGVGL